MLSPSKISIKVAQAILVVILGMTSRTPAQELEISGSPTPVGSGARAAGMADAFVAIADDATAASWNPAGLVQLERPELSIVGSYTGLLEEFAAIAHPEVDSLHRAGKLDLNYLSIVYPLPSPVLGRNVCLSLNYQQKYDFSRRFRLRYNQAVHASTGGVFESQLDMAFEQEGGLSTITPACAFEITPQLSLGMSLNLWRSSFLSDNGWQQMTHSDMMVQSEGEVGRTLVDRIENYGDFEGENLTVGALWNITDRWSLGARYDTPFTAHAAFSSLSRKLEQQLVVSYVEEKRSLRFPPTVAIGTAYRVNDRLTLSFDVTRTDWNEFFFRDAQGNRYSLVDASTLDDPSQSSHFDPTTTIRLGTEYVFIPTKRGISKKLRGQLVRGEDLGEVMERPTLKYLWTLRGGVFYDEEPASGKSNNNVAIVSASRGSGRPDRFYGLALGCGLLAHQRVNIDVAYQFRFGQGVNRDFIRGLSGFSEDVLQHRFLISTVIYF